MGQYGYEWMPGYGMGYAFGWVFMVLLWGLIVLGVVAIVKWILWDTVMRRYRVVRGPRHEALRILDERYARGELGREEYLEKKADLSG